MKVFNLAEELEKERKKNKELEEKLEEEKQYKKFYENMYLASADIRTQFRKINENLIDRINKAIEYIKEHSTTIDYKTMKADYNLNMNDLLDILRGDNNE